MATYQTIREQLDKLCLLYQRGIPDLALDEIALEWRSTLGGINDDVFIRAVRRHRQRSQYWPTEAGIILLAREIADEDTRNQQRLALPEMTPSPEMFANNRRQAQKLLEKLGVNMAAPQ